MKSHYKKFFYLIIVLCFSLVILGCDNQNAVDAEQESYWPTSSPEAQGMDSETLLEMLETTAGRGMDIHSLLIIRNGHLVLESDFYPYRNDVPHMVHSITKNFTATLIGIAIEDGYIEGVDQKMVELLPGLDLDHLDERINDITVEDLLTMQTGLHWGPGNASSNEMYYENDNQLLYALEREMVNDPGDVFEYNSGSTHILSVILTKATGMSTLEYADEKIFSPLNITDVQWAVDQQDYHVGGDMMFMKPEDLAKFGYLHLQQGTWKDEQIIPKDWVDVATKDHDEEETYGYSWWVADYGGYFGSGVAGQHLAIFPEEDLIVVITSGIGNRAGGILNSIMENWILEAVIDDEPIDENPEVYSQLQSLVEEFHSPDERIEDVTLPYTAEEISGNTYLMDNDDSYTFNFNGEEALWVWHRQGIGEYEVTIGLDNIYRNNRLENFLLFNQIDTDAAIRGHWEDDNTFILDVRCLENPVAYFYEFQFDGDTLHHTRTNRLNNSVYLNTTGTVME